MIFAPFEFYKAVLEADLDSFDEQITPLSMKFRHRLMCVLDLVLNSSQDKEDLNEDRYVFKILKADPKKGSVGFSLNKLQKDMIDYHTELISEGKKSSKFSEYFITLLDTENKATEREYLKSKFSSVYVFTLQARLAEHSEFEIQPLSEKLEDFIHEC